MHIIYGEFVDDEMQLFLSSNSWQLAAIDFIDDVSSMLNDHISENEIKKHINVCVNNLIHNCEKYPFLKKTLKKQGLYIANTPYENLDKKLKLYLNNERIFTKNNLELQWPIKGIFWSGIHSEICLAGHISQTIKLYPALQNYILENCCVNMKSENFNFLNHFTKTNWNNTFLLDTKKLKIKDLI